MRALLTTAAEILPVSLEATRRFPLRTALSVIGVVIGVAAVIAMLAVSEGGRLAILRQVNRLGLQNLMIRNQVAQDRRGDGLRLRDMDGLRILLPAARRVAAVIEQTSRVAGPAAAVETVVLGVTPEYIALRQVGVSAGRPLTAFDEGQERVCLLGGALSEQLFGTRDPVGRAVRLENEWFTVVGVVGQSSAPERSGEAPFPSQDHDDAVLVPLAAILGHDRRVPDQAISELWIEAADDLDPMAVKPQAARVIETLHRGRRDFDIVAPVELLAHRLEAQRVFNVVLASIATLALLVGGIGIMNIMLASVLERTPEIGLRRTVGATRGWILGQFVLESVAVTAAGGILGVLAGVGASRVVMAYAGWPVHVASWAIAIALGAAVIVGLVFGLYPAVRAARLQPIDAVRYE